MCIIAYKPPGNTITKRTLKTCWDNNPDGAGFMFADATETLHVRKGYMAWREFYRAYRAAEHKHLSSDFVIHFRIGTSGHKNPENTHPFRINNDIAFVHNGILWDIPQGDKADSDTATFCKQMQADFPKDFLQQRVYRQLLEAYAIQESSKFVFMDSRRNTYIFNQDAGEWHKGIWYSNTTYKHGRWAKYYYGGFDDFDDAEDEHDQKQEDDKATESGLCQDCYTPLVPRDALICYACGAYQDDFALEVDQISKQYEKVKQDKTKKKDLPF